MISSDSLCKLEDDQESRGVYGCSIKLYQRIIEAFTMELPTAYLNDGIYGRAIQQPTAKRHNFLLQ